jgi:uncharacterized protein
MPVRTTYPGVYIQEQASGTRTIVGVSTSVTAFVGAAAKGPVEKPRRIFSYADFVRIFGGPISADNPMGYAVQHFFANGGSEAVVVRVLPTAAKRASAALKSGNKEVLVVSAAGRGSWANNGGGRGVEIVVQDSTLNSTDLFNLVVQRVETDPRTSTEVVAEQEDYANVALAPKHPRYVLNMLGASNLVVPALPASAPTAAGTASSTSKAAIPDPILLDASNNALRLSVDYGPAADIVVFPAETRNAPEPVSKTAAALVTELNTRFAGAGVGATAKLSTGKLVIESNAGTTLDAAVVVMPAPEGDLTEELQLGRAWGGTETTGIKNVKPTAGTFGLTGGDDGGATISPSDVVPSSGIGGIYALNELRKPRFNLLCLPDLNASHAAEIQNALKYCRDERGFLIVDSPPNGFATDPPDLGAFATFGAHGAIYYPRFSVIERIEGGATRKLNLPAAGAVAGLMARTDAARGIWKAPAGLDAGIVGATELTRPTDDNLSGQLNPLGVNVLRTFPGAGMVAWGARTLRGSDDLASEHKYIPVRRLTDFIASSLYFGTQFAVFEPNDPDLWAQLRLAATTFMRGLFRQGAFQQSPKRDEAHSFFVVCDETVNPQSEIDLGRVNVIVGFAPLKPAEFVVITITQMSHVEE